jgi:sugar phosphate isomerase/epimerase
VELRRAFRRLSCGSVNCGSSSNPRRIKTWLGTERGLRYAIGFAEWIVTTMPARCLERASDMDPCVRSAARTCPPLPGRRRTVALLKAAERFRKLIEIGDSIGVLPQLEVWGFSTTLSRLGETMLVATEARHPKACVLLDVYHLHKGGSEFAGLKLLSGAAMHCFHMNDFPATPPRETIRDADRVYPGDGVAPLTQIIRDLVSTGFAGTFAELFNPPRNRTLRSARTGPQMKTLWLKQPLSRLFEFASDFARRPAFAIADDAGGLFALGLVHV